MRLGTGVTKKADSLTFLGAVSRMSVGPSIPDSVQEVGQTPSSPRLQLQELLSQLTLAPYYNKESEESNADLDPPQNLPRYMFTWVSLWLVLLLQNINKRLSLPADLHLPEEFLAKQNVIPSVDRPLTRASRRQSLSEIGFGRMETYTKLDKLGQVRKQFVLFCKLLNSSIYPSRSFEFLFRYWR